MFFMPIPGTEAAALGEPKSDGPQLLEARWPWSLVRQVRSLVAIDVKLLVLGACAASLCRFAEVIHTGQIPPLQRWLPISGPTRWLATVLTDRPTHRG